MQQTTIKDIKEKVLPILKKADVKKAALFGSYVRGDAQKNSDIDMLIEAPKGTGLFAFISLHRRLEHALKKKVDLVTYKSIHPLLREDILKEQFPIL